MKYKKIIATALALASVISLGKSTVYATEREYSWYCIRCGNKQPPVTDEEKLLCGYGGFSIDRSVNDSSERKVIYLTFDCGYINENVIKILDTLKDEEVSAAFFLLDNPIIKNTDTVKRMISEGHLLCNHTKKHKNISSYTKEQICEDLSALERLYTEKTGEELAKYFRFPEGRYSISALEKLEELGYTTIFWSFAYDDWDNSRQMDVDKAFEKVLNNTHNGAVFLFHPTSNVNAEIFPDLIKEWKKNGYTFGTLDELCK